MSQARPGNSATRFFADRKVGTKVLVAVGSLALVAGSVGVLSISRLGQVQDRAADLSDSNIPSLKTVALLGATSSRPGSTSSTTLSAWTRRRWRSTRRPSKADDQKLADDLAAYRSSNPVSLPEVEQFETAWKGTRRCATRSCSRPAGRNQPAVFQKVRDTGRKPIANKARQLLTAADDAEQVGARPRRRRPRATAASARTLVLGFLLLGLLLGLGLALCVAQLITGPLARVSRC